MRVVFYEHRTSLEMDIGQEVFDLYTSVCPVLGQRRRP
jgi:hypothetical protein